MAASMAHLLGYILPFSSETGWYTAGHRMLGQYDLGALPSVTFLSLLSDSSLAESSVLLSSSTPREAPKDFP